MSGALGGRKRFVALAIAVLAVVAILWFAFFREPEQVKAPIPALAVPEGQAGKAGEVLVTQEAMKLAEIDVAPAKLQQVQERLQVSGSIQTGGNQLAKVTPPAAGKAVKLLVSVGDSVRQGQVLALLDSAELARAQADYKQAIARSEALENALASQRELAELGAFGSAELEESQSLAVSAEKELQESGRALATGQSRIVDVEGQLKVAKSERHHSQVELDLAKAHLKRAEAVPKLLSLQQMERLRADVHQAEAHLHEAEAAVSRSQAELVAAREHLKAAQKEQPLARREVEIRRSAVAREEKVYAGGHARNRELVQAETDARLARVEAEAAAENVRLLGGSPGQGSEIPLVAPISGTVQEAHLTLGETVDPDHLAFSIVNLEESYAELAIAPSDLAKVKVGDPVELFSDAAPQTPFQAELTSIGAITDPVTRTVAARAKVRKASPLLKAGSFVKAAIITDVRSDRLTVPQEALQDHLGRATLYVAKPESGLFEVRHVELGTEGEGWREVIEGLQPGEKLATHGTFYLKSEAMKSALSDGCCAVGE
jgi:cobalt-zinc-cadmium efflux system membrane fusion protein